MNEELILFALVILESTSKEKDRLEDAVKRLEAIREKAKEIK